MIGFIKNSGFPDYSCNLTMEKGQGHMNTVTVSRRVGILRKYPNQPTRITPSQSVSAVSNAEPKGQGQSQIQMTASALAEVDEVKPKLEVIDADADSKDEGDTAEAKELNKPKPSVVCDQLQGIVTQMNLRVRSLEELQEPKQTRPVYSRRIRRRGSPIPQKPKVFVLDANGRLVQKGKANTVHVPSPQAKAKVKVNVLRRSTIRRVSPVKNKNSTPSNSTASEIKNLLSEFCDSDCNVCEEMILKLSLHVSSNHQGNRGQGQGQKTPEFQDDSVDSEEDEFKMDMDAVPNVVNVEMSEPVRMPTPAAAQEEPSTPAPATRVVDWPLLRQGSNRCILCKKFFTHEADLAAHLNKIHPPIVPADVPEEERKKLIKTQIMNKAFQLAGTGMRLRTNVPDIKPKFTLEPITKKIICTICDEKFVKMNRLEEHYQDVHDPFKVVFTCPECGSQFGSEKRLKQHFNMNHPTAKLSYDCTICADAQTESGNTQEFEFPTMYLLKAHVIKLHCTEEEKEKQKPLKCPHTPCRKKFSCKGHYDAHIRKHHPPEENPFRCSTCGKNCKTRRLLKCHEEIHLGLKPFMCEVCSKCFTKGNSLTKHKLIHTGEKPHICDQCGRAFRDRSVLATHYKLHTGERPHKCKVCGKGYILAANLRFHMKSHNLKEGKPGKNNKKRKGKGQRSPSSASTTSEEDN